MLKFTTHTRFMFWILVFGFWFNRYWFSWIDSISKQLYLVLCILDSFYIHACFNFLDKLSLICLFMCFGVLVFLTKHILVIKVKNNDMYMFLVYWTYVHMQHALKCLSIMFLYLDKCWTKFNWKIKFGKIQVLVFGNFSITQNGSKCLIIVLKFLSHVYITYIMLEIIFVDF